MQKVLVLSGVTYFNFFSYEHSETLAGMVRDGWILKETFAHIQGRSCTVIMEKKETENEV